MFWKNIHYFVSGFMPIIIVVYFIFIYKRLLWGKMLRNLKNGTLTRKLYYAEKLLLEKDTENYGEKEKIEKAVNQVNKKIKLFRIKSLLLLLFGIILCYLFYFTKENMIYTSSEDMADFYKKYKNLSEILEIEAKINTKYNSKEAKEIIEKLQNLKKDIKNGYKNFKQEEKFTVIIDVGHGGVDPGTIRGNYYEKNINLDIALILKRNLEKNNINAILTRSEDKNMHMFDRIYPSFYYKNMIFISLHVNSWENSDINGYDVFYYSGKKGIYYYEESKKTAEIFYENLKNQNLIKARNVRDANFTILKYMNTIAPSLLFEMGFITNDNDFYVLNNKDTKEKIAENICNSLKKNIKTNLRK